MPESMLRSVGQGLALVESEQLLCMRSPGQQAKASLLRSQLGSQPSNKGLSDLTDLTVLSSAGQVYLRLHKVGGGEAGRAQSGGGRRMDRGNARLRKWKGQIKMQGEP